MIISDAALAPVDMQSERPLSYLRAVAQSINARHHVFPIYLEDSQIFLLCGAFKNAF